MATSQALLRSTCPCWGTPAAGSGGLQRRSVAAAASATSVSAPPSASSHRQQSRAHLSQPELLDARLFPVEFAEYTQATQMLSKLQGQATDLALLLEQLNAVEATLDEALLAPPTSPHSPDNREDRKAKRAAKRAERKAQGEPEGAEAAARPPPAAAAPAATAAAAPPAGQAQAGAPVMPRHGPASASVQQLEELFKLTTEEPELPPQASSAQAKAAVLTPRRAAPKRVAPRPAAAASVLLPVHPTEAAPPAHAPLEGQMEHSATMPARPAPEPAPQQELTQPPEAAVRSAPAASSSSSALQASARVARTAEQLAVMPTGPSLLNLAPVARSTRSSASASSRQSRRSGHYGRGARPLQAAEGAAAAVVPASARSSGSSDSITQLLSSGKAVLDATLEKDVTEVCRDYLLLEKVRRQCHKTLQRPPTKQELAAAVGMDLTSFDARYEAGLQAKELLLKTNYKLVMAVCKPYIGKGHSLQDLISEGLRGLLRGVEKFDTSKGFRFSTYAHWWIRQAVSRSMAEQGRIVRLPIHMVEQLSKVKKASRELRVRLGREPDMAELSAATSFEPSRIQLLFDSEHTATSLDTPLADDDNAMTAKDMVEDEGPTADSVFQLESLRHDLEGMLSTLTEREAAVVRLRFGLEDGREWTLEEIGERLRVTRERIRQIEAKALRKLKVMTVAESGVLKEYGDNLGALESFDLAARTSSGIKKSK